MLCRTFHSLILNKAVPFVMSQEWSDLRIKCFLFKATIIPTPFALILSFCWQNLLHRVVNTWRATLVNGRRSMNPSAVWRFKAAVDWLSRFRYFVLADLLERQFMTGDPWQSEVPKPQIDDFETNQVTNGGRPGGINTPTPRCERWAARFFLPRYHPLVSAARPWWASLPQTGEEATEVERWLTFGGGGAQRPH